MSRRALLPTGPRLVAADVLVVVWVLFWCVVGVRVGIEVRDLGRLSASVERVGRAVSDTGAALGSLGDVPVLGERLTAAAAPVSEAGEAAQATARSSRGAARDLSVLLGLSIALAPSLPMLLLYLPDRVAVARDRRAVAAAVRDELPPEIAELLARRAIVHVPLHRLRLTSEDPQGDLMAGRYEDLARAELRRLGIHSG